MANRKAEIKARLQVVIQATTVKRVRVDAAERGLTVSQNADRIFSSHLNRYGKGRAVGDLAVLDPDPPAGEGHAA